MTPVIHDPRAIPSPSCPLHLSHSELLEIRQTDFTLLCPGSYCSHCLERPSLPHAATASSPPTMSLPRESASLPPPVPHPMVPRTEFSHLVQPQENFTGHQSFMVLPCPPPRGHRPHPVLSVSLASSTEQVLRQCPLRALTDGF